MDLQSEINTLHRFTHVEIILSTIIEMIRIVRMRETTEEAYQFQRGVELIYYKLSCANSI